MERIVKIKIVKKILLFIFILIATFGLFMFFGSYFISGMSGIASSSVYFMLIFTMSISAIVVKYLGDIVIVALDRDRENKN